MRGPCRETGPVRRAGSGTRNCARSSAGRSGRDGRVPSISRACGDGLAVLLDEADRQRRLEQVEHGSDGRQRRTPFGGHDDGPVDQDGVRLDGVEQLRRRRGLGSSRPSSS